MGKRGGFSRLFLILRKYKIVFYGGGWVLSEQFNLVRIQVIHYVNINTGALFSTIISKLIIMSRMIFSAYELRIHDKYI